MNRQDTMSLLLSTLYGFDIHPDLAREIIDIIIGSGYERKFFTLFATRLKYLNLHGIRAIEQREFELLGNSNGIYSMHLDSNCFNIRILYSFLPDGSPSLLTCFYERAGKRKTDYSGKISLAADRFKEQLEAYENEQE